MDREEEKKRKRIFNVEGKASKEFMNKSNPENRDQIVEITSKQVKGQKRLKIINIFNINQLSLIVECKNCKTRIVRN